MSPLLTILSAFLCVIHFYFLLLVKNRQLLSISKAQTQERENDKHNFPVFTKLMLSLHAKHWMLKLKFIIPFQHKECALLKFYCYTASVDGKRFYFDILLPFVKEKKCCFCHCTLHTSATSLTGAIGGEGCLHES